MSDELKTALQRPGSFLQTVQAVAWSFFGVRRRADWEQDLSKVNPVHLVVAGLMGALLFILALVLLVRWVISSGIAA